MRWTGEMIWPGGRRMEKRRLFRNGWPSWKTSVPCCFPLRTCPGKYQSPPFTTARGRSAACWAYRIITNSEKLHDHPCFGKYVLLRVVRVQKHPVSRLFDTGYYDESMDVALYNWIGDVILEPGIVERLHFIPIMEPAKKHVRMPQIAALKNLPEKSQDHFRQAWKEMPGPVPASCHEHRF